MPKLLNNYGNSTYLLVTLNVHPFKHIVWQWQWQWNILFDHRHTNLNNNVQ